MSDATRTSDMRKEATVLSFVITSHLAKCHPGVVSVRGRLGGSYHDVGGYQGIRLYEGTHGQVGAAFHIAQAIYEEETRQRASYPHDARFDFSTPSKLYFFQKREEEPAARKREIASLALPGGQSREEVCHAIAQALLSGWEKPPDTAYIRPEQLTSERGAIIYGRDGSRLTHVVTFEHNGQPVEAPVALIAWTKGSMRFATIHPGTAVGGELFSRYFTLLETDQGWVLCDDGAHDLDEPLSIADRDPAGATWHYISHHFGFSPVLRSDERATYAPFSWRLSDDEDHTLTLISHLDTAVTTCSQYCSLCRRGWLWDTDEQELHALCEQGSLPTVCAHCWMCPDCGRWSTPTSRAPRYERFPCQHARPLVAEQRLPVQDWRMATQWRTGRILAPRPPFIRALPPPGEIEADVLLVFHAPWPGAETGGQGRPDRWKGVDIPQGTRLVGIWDHWQPPSGNEYRVVLDEERWSIPADLVGISCPLAQRASPRAQIEVAQDSLRAATALEGTEGQEATLLLLYARAVIEFVIGGATVLELSPARLRYAHLLLANGQVERATREMELAARECERAIVQSSVSTRDTGRIDRGLLVIDALMTLGRLYLQQGKHADLLLDCGKRLRSCETASSRYPLHRELRFLAALLLAKGSPVKEATQQLRQLESQFEYLSDQEREYYAEAMVRLRAELHPEDALLAHLQDALATYRGESVEQVREREGAIRSRESRREWSEQLYSIYLRANRPNHPKDAIDLQENHQRSYGRTLSNGADLRVFELAQQGPLVAGRLLATLLLNDLEARDGDYSWERAVDYHREMTVLVSLSVGVGMAAGGKRALRYALFPYGECVFPAGMSRNERIVHLADVLDLGVRLLALVLPDAAGVPDRSADGQPLGVVADRLPVSEADVTPLARIRRYGLARLYAPYVRDGARSLLSWVREQLTAVGDDQGCQLWRGGSEAPVGSHTIPVVPRELVWVLAHEEPLPLNTSLWPRCGKPECVLPEHQWQVISYANAILELEARLGGKENARSAIEDGKHRGALPILASPRGEEGFACADFDLWLAAPAFTECYVSGKGTGGGGQEGLKPRFEQLTTGQRAQIAVLWGLRTGGVSSKELTKTWGLAHDDPFAARFVWQALKPQERTVLYCVLGFQSQTGMRRIDLLRKTGLTPEELDAALDRLESLLLLHIDYLPNREDLWQMIDGAGYGPMLLHCGEELLSAQDPTQLTLSQHLASLPAASLSQVAQRYGFSPPRTTSEVGLLRRTILEALLKQPGRVFLELGRLNFPLQRLAAVVYEQGGCVPVKQVAATLEIDLPTLYDLLREARSLCLLHEAFAPTGERVLFVPSDLYEAGQRLNGAPRTRRQLDDYLTPTYVRERVD